MAICKKIKRISKRVCIGSLNKRIIIKTRNIGFASDNNVDFTEASADKLETFAMVQTVEGIQVFDDSNLIRNISHDFYIRYLFNVTFEDRIWFPVQFGNPIDRYFEIIKVENLNEENRFYRIRCAERGDAGKPVNRN